MMYMLMYKCVYYMYSFTLTDLKPQNRKRDSVNPCWGGPQMQHDLFQELERLLPFVALLGALSLTQDFFLCHSDACVHESLQVTSQTSRNMCFFETGSIYHV